MSGICWQARTSQDLPIKTTNREGRRFESCRARHRKPRKLRGFALEFHPFSWPGSPFDRNLTAITAWRSLSGPYPIHTQEADPRATQGFIVVNAVLCRIITRKVCEEHAGDSRKRRSVPCD